MICNRQYPSQEFAHRMAAPQAAAWFYEQKV